MSEDANLLQLDIGKGRALGFVGRQLMPSFQRLILATTISMPV